MFYSTLGPKCSSDLIKLELVSKASLSDLVIKYTIFTSHTEVKECVLINILKNLPL